MDDFLNTLYIEYIIPHVENRETLKCISEFYQDLPQPHKDRCEHLLRKYALRAFQLGVRTGVRLGD